MRVVVASSDEPTTVFRILDKETVARLATPAMLQKRGRFDGVEDHGGRVEPCCRSPPTAAARCCLPPTAAAHLPSPAAARLQLQRRTPVRMLNHRQDPLLIRRPPDLHVVVAPPTLQGSIFFCLGTGTSPATISSFYLIFKW